MTLEQDVSTWDGKSSDDIKAVYSHHAGDPDFIECVIAMIRRGESMNGATWLLKHALDLGESLDEDSIHDIYQSLPELTDWQARLHVLQCLPRMPVSAEDRPAVEAFVRNGITDGNKFVRAWSYNGLHELARQYPELDEDARIILDIALRDEAPSVVARIRKIRTKKG